MENEERSRLPRKFDDAKLEALLDEDDGQTQQMIAEQLGETFERHDSNENRKTVNL